MGENQNIELPIPLTAATEATSKTQNQSCTFRRKCAAVVSGGIVLAIKIAVMSLIPQDTTPPTPNDPPSTPPDDYEEYYDYIEILDPDYDNIELSGGYTTEAKIKDVS